MSFDIVIEGRMVDPVNGEFHGCMGIRDGMIELLTERPIEGRKRISLSDHETVFPGFIDTHVHFREPGWEHKGDMHSESRAAALGGVTTAMEMPNTLVQTTSRERVLEKIRIARESSAIDILFYGGVGPGNLYALENMADVVPAFKLFMCESTGNLRLDSAEDVEEAFSRVAGTGKPLAVHAEDQVINSEAAGRHSYDEHGHLVHARSRPAESEVKAIGDALRFSGKHGTRLSVCHVSTREGLEAVRKHGNARAEVSIHHSLLSHGDLERLGALAKMNPPVREKGDSDYVLDSLVRGRVDFLGTDHAPHTLEEKGALFPEAPSGVPAVEFYGGFASMLLSRGMMPDDLARATSYNAAQFFGLEGKARIEEGYLADLVVLDMGRGFSVKGPYAAKCGWSPFEGMRFPGRPSCTIKSGKIIAENGKMKV